MFSAFVGQSSHIKTFVFLHYELEYYSLHCKPEIVHPALGALNIKFENLNREKKRVLEISSSRLPPVGEAQRSPLRKFFVIFHF